MDKRQIHFLRFLLEAYEGVAVLSTIDNSSGLVSLLIAPGREAEAAELVAAMKERMMLEPLPAGEYPPSGSSNMPTLNVQ